MAGNRFQLDLKAGVRKGETFEPVGLSRCYPSSSFSRGACRLDVFFRLAAWSLEITCRDGEESFAGWGGRCRGDRPGDWRRLGTDRSEGSERGGLQPGPDNDSVGAGRLAQLDQRGAGRGSPPAAAGDERDEERSALYPDGALGERPSLRRAQRSARAARSRFPLLRPDSRQRWKSDQVPAPSAGLCRNGAAPLPGQVGDDMERRHQGDRRRSGEPTCHRRGALWLGIATSRSACIRPDLAQPAKSGRDLTREGAWLRPPPQTHGEGLPSLIDALAHRPSCGVWLAHRLPD